MTNQIMQFKFQTNQINKPIHCTIKNCTEFNNKLCMFMHLGNSKIKYS